MKLKSVAVTVAYAAAVLMVGPSPASAEDASLFVNDAAGANCSDSGPGTQAAPFCTVQAAADVVNPGQTVRLLSGSVGPLSITRSGMPGQPIVFAGDYLTTQVANNVHARLGMGPSGLLLSGIHDVVFTGVVVTSVGGTGPTVTVTGSTRVVLDGDDVAGSVDVTGASNAVVVRRSVLSSMVVEGGATGTQVSTNEFPQGRARPTVVVTGASGTAVVSNTVWGQCDGIDVSGAATGTVLENNVLITQLGGTCTNQAQLAVTADAVAGTTEKYNVFDSSYNGSTPLAYRWADTPYATVAQFQTATGQGGQDVIANLGAVPLPWPGVADAPAVLIDSADANAPGEVDTDLYGNPREDDSYVANTGTGPGFYDRGAGELQDQLRAVDTYWPSFSDGITPPASAFTALSAFARTDMLQGWGGPGQVTYDWGDGTSSTVTAVAVPGDSGRATIMHVYPQPGTYTIIRTASDGLKTVSATESFTTKGAGYVPLAPTRILDTRTGLGTAGVAKPLAGNGVLSLKVAGLAGVPTSGVSAVVLNVTVTHSTKAGYIGVSPGVTQPGTTTWSALNYGPGQTIANLVTAIMGTAMIGTDGFISFNNASAGTVDVIADIAGYYQYAPGSGYRPLSPVRVLDTRTGTGAAKHPATAGSTTTVQMTGRNGIPSAGVTAIAVNLTVTNTHTGGYITGYPTGLPRPTVSNLNFPAGGTLANMAIIPVGTDGSVSLYNGSGASLDLIADVAGYYTTNGGYHLVTFGGPTRELDTRTASPGRAAGPVPASGVVTLTDPFAAKAYVMNTTVTNTKATGYLTVYPDGTSRPLASNLNHTTGQTIAVHAQTPVGATSAIDFYNGSSGSLDVIADLYGYFD